MTKKIVVLAAGRGTRMRAAGSTDISREQASAADSGEKAMIPIGRPFLDYALSACADAGFTDVCLVVGPGESATRTYYERIDTRRLQICFAVQAQPLGVANAVLAARAFVGDDSFVVVNSDNYYPASVLAELRRAQASALPAFSRDGLLNDGQIAAERIAAYALLEIDAEGLLRRIVEKPSVVEAAAMAGAPVSMNCWLFDPRIFEACERVPKSARGEFELPGAVQLGIDAIGMRFRTFPVDAGVLDLSSRGDIPGVERRLRSVRVEL
jgi:glucose-1-phosphate thymidylyltransferase